MRETNFERQQREQAKRTRDMLKVASVHFNPSGQPGIARVTKLNDNDPSTYVHGRRVGPGPANPNMFWERQKTELVSDKKANDMVELVEAKQAGFGNVKDWKQHEAQQKYIREQQQRARWEAEQRQIKAAREANKARPAAEREARLAPLRKLDEAWDNATRGMDIFALEEFTDRQKNQNGLNKLHPNRFAPSQFTPEYFEYLRRGRRLAK